MIVVPVTSEIHSETFARALGSRVERDVVEGEEWALFVGGAPTPLAKKFKEAKYKTAVYWIGSDSLCALQDANYRKQIDEYDIHLCVHERIQAELKSWNIDAKVVYPCSRNYSTGLGETNGKLVGVYMPDPGLYMFDECKQIAVENPEIPFIFYGAMFEMTGLPANVQDGKRLSPEEVIGISDKISVMLRLCRHDGFPVGGIEIKQRNRNIIENFPYPGFLYAHTMEDVTKHLKDENTHKKDDSPWPSWYREKCSPENFKKEIYKHLGI